MPIVVFHGNDIKLLRKELGKWEERMQGEIPDLEIYAPDQPALSEILNKISSDSLFGGTELIKIYDFEKVPKIEALLDYQTEHFITLISYQEKNPLKKKKGIEIKEFNLPRSYQLEKIIFQRFRGKMSPETVEYISRNITSLVDLDEIEEKMEEENIPFLDLEKFSRIRGDIEIKVFLIIEDILNQKIQSSIIEMNQYLDSGGNPGALVSQLFHQINRLLSVKKMNESGVPEKEISESLKVHPFVIKKMIQTASLYSMAKMEKVLMGIPRLELSLRYHDPAFHRYFFEKWILEMGNRGGK
jgi:DNA polymerase III delta subunit